MEAIAVALFLLLAVVVSGAIARMSPVPLPLPLVQIALGSIASVANLGVALKPDIFFLLFLPPLLFLAGWRIPKEGLFRDKGTILELALGLVLFTVVGVGFFINWMIPEMPVAIAHEPVWLLIYVVAVSCALAALRFLWVWTSLRFTLFRAALKGQKPVVPSWRLIAATSLAGVRGTITLAGVKSQNSL